MKRARITVGGARAWSAGDRVGKTHASDLRELHVRACLGYEIDRDRYADLIELHERTLDAIGRVSDDDLHETDIPIEEVPDAIDALIETLAKLNSSLHAATREHERDMREAYATCDELRKRAELAEHALQVRAAATPMRRRSATEKKAP